MQALSRTIADRLEAAGSVRPVHIASLCRFADDEKRMEAPGPTIVVGCTHSQAAQVARRPGRVLTHIDAVGTISRRRFGRGSDVAREHRRPDQEASEPATQQRDCQASKDE
jgi:hypothetical protein